MGHVQENTGWRNIEQKEFTQKVQGIYSTSYKNSRAIGTIPAKETTQRLMKLYALELDGKVDLAIFDTHSVP